MKEPRKKDVDWLVRMGLMMIIASSAIYLAARWLA